MQDQPKGKVLLCFSKKRPERNLLGVFGGLTPAIRLAPRLPAAYASGDIVVVHE